MKHSRRAHPPHDVRVYLIILMLALCSCAKQSRQFIVADSDSPASASVSAKLDLNTATVTELERLPGIGNVIATRIVEHRAKNGPFRRSEHLMMVRGISEAKFRELSPLVIAR